MSSHAAHWLPEILLETVDRKTTPLYFLWDFHNKTLGLVHDKRLFLKKTSVFGIACEVNVEVNNGLILICNLLILLFPYLKLFSSITRLRFRKKEKKSAHKQIMLTEESTCRSAPPLNQQLSVHYVPAVINLVWQIQLGSGWRAGVLS